MRDVGSRWGRTLVLVVTIVATLTPAVGSAEVRAGTDDAVRCSPKIFFEVDRVRPRDSGAAAVIGRKAWWMCTDTHSYLQSAERSSRLFLRKDAVVKVWVHPSDPTQGLERIKPARLGRYLRSWGIGAQRHFRRNRPFDEPSRFVNIWHS